MIIKDKEKTSTKVSIIEPTFSACLLLRLRSYLFIAKLSCLPYASRIFNFQMQKHNEWLSNKGYMRHLETLSKISARKTHNNLNKTCPLRPRDRSYDSKDPRQQQPNENAFQRSKEGVTMRDQQILWDNYHLGKRIIETPPVISKKKLDEEYRRHRLIVQSMTTSTSRKTMPTQFRVKKLQQYKENLEQHHQDLAQQNIGNHNSIKIQIKGLAFYRERHTLDNLDLVFAYPTKTGKRHRQGCEGFPALEILERHFYFAVPKRLRTGQEALTLQIRNLKGLNVFSVGIVSFPSAVELVQYKAQMFHCGKAIGEVQLTTSYHCRRAERSP